MTLQECYAALGGDYASVLSRLRSERLVQKFVLKFLNDGSYDLLCTSLKNENYEEAFRAAHTIKGICQNLSFTRLEESSAALTEELRAGRTQNLEGFMDKVTADYLRIVETVRSFQEGLS